MSDLVGRAARFAGAAHASIDQRRKYTGEPYIVHPAVVTSPQRRTSGTVQTGSVYYPYRTGAAYRPPQMISNCRTIPDRGSVTEKS